MDRGARILQWRFDGSDPAIQRVESLLVGLSDEYDARYGENIEMTRASEAEFDASCRALHRSHGRADYCCGWWLPPIQREHM